MDVDPWLLAILKGYLPQSRSEFVINSPVQPRVTVPTYRHYRAERHFNRLIKWLRSNGVNTGNPLHTLRKEFGSQIAAQAGIFAASLALNVLRDRQDLAGGRGREKRLKNVMLTRKDWDFSSVAANERVACCHYE